MQYDIIIGNPPYQLNDGGYGASAQPIYHKFVQGAKLLNPEYFSFIIPARWYTTGKGLDDFRSEMLSSRNISHIYDFPESKRVFQDVDIKGGVCYFLWDRNHDGDTTIVNFDGNTATRQLNEFKWLIRNNKAISILRKVLAKETEFFDSKVSSRNPFGIPTNFAEYADVDVDVDVDVDSKTDLFKIYANGKVGWVEQKYVVRGQALVSKWKVIVSKAYGGGEKVGGQYVTSLALVAKPNEVCTETYLVLGAFDDEESAMRLKAYVATKFFRFMLSLLKITQDTSKEKFSFVPDVGLEQYWTDDALYERYGLDDGDVAFIEAQVRAYS